MNTALVTLSYKQVIDASMHGWFERSVIDSSYEEFLLKSQAYNPEKKFKTFTEMKTNDGRANSLHYKCGFPVIPFVDIPGRVGTVPPAQIDKLDPKLNVGTRIGLIVTLNSAVVAHCPLVGVNV